LGNLKNSSHNLHYYLTELTFPLIKYLIFSDSNKLIS